MNGIRIVCRLQTTRPRRIAGIVGLFVLIAAGFAMRYHIRKKWEKDHVFVHARPIETSLGWGYEILAGDTIYIRQEFIPAIAGKRGFRSREDAMKVGMKIISNMKHGKQEAVTVEDLKSLGVIDSIPASSMPLAPRLPDGAPKLTPAIAKPRTR